jgi:hypothetical protein
MAIFTCLFGMKGNVMHVCMCCPAGGITADQVLALQAAANAIIAEGAVQRAKRQRTVTDAAAVGSIIVSTNKLIDLGILPVRSTPLPTCITPTFIRQWDAANRKDDIQVRDIL